MPDKRGTALWGRVRAIEIPCGCWARLRGGGREKTVEMSSSAGTLEDGSEGESRGGSLRCSFQGWQPALLAQQPTSSLAATPPR